MEFHHQPVLLREAVEALNVQAGGTYVDGTLGGGGHSEAILNEKPDIELIGMDQDPQALEAARNRLAGFGEQVVYIHSNFRRLAVVLEELGRACVDGVLLDIGVSSPQLDQVERGFSYQQDAVLDMRMDPSNPVTAYHLVNSLPETELARIISEYGEERWALRIASFIVEYRSRQPVESTHQLGAIIKQAIPASARRQGPHPAKRTFQALRMAVNQELDALEEGLQQAVQVLRPGGRLCVITFHSLEDRTVKEAFRGLAQSCVCPPSFPVCICQQQPTIKILTRKPVTPSDEELQGNPRARSAKLRVCQRLKKEERRT